MRSDDVLEALMQSVDREKLDAALGELAPPPSPSSGASTSGASPGGPGPAAEAALKRLLLSDILDESILGARPGDAAFPLRAFLGTLASHLDDDDGFALATGLNFYFRARAGEEAKTHMGLEVSRLFYAWADAALGPSERATVAPILAQLMSMELERLRFEAVDGARAFDSSSHERAPGSAKRPQIQRPASFLCRVVSNGMVRARAEVRT